MKLCNFRYFDHTDQPTRPMMINNVNFLGWLVAALMLLPERVVKVKLKIFNSRYFDPTDQPNAMMINNGNFLGCLVAL